MKTTKVPIDARLFPAYEAYSRSRFNKILIGWNYCLNKHLMTQAKKEEQYNNDEWIEISERYLAKAISKGASEVVSDDTARRIIQTLVEASILVKRVSGGSGSEEYDRHGTLWSFSPPETLVKVYLPPMTYDNWRSWKGNRESFEEEVKVDVELLIDTVLRENVAGLYEKSTRVNGLSRDEQAKILSQVWFYNGGNEFGWPISREPDGGRVHHPIQQLPPELRLLTVRIDGEAVGSVDIAATQLTILHTLMTNSKEKEAFGKIRDKGAYEYISNWLLDNREVVMSQGPKTIWKGTRRQHWRTYWEKFLNEPSSRREMTKKFTSHYCYLNRQDANGINTILDLFFATNFPVVHALIVSLRSDDTKNVAREFQKIEQTIMSGVEIPNVNVHDEVLVPSSKVYEVAEVIKERFKKIYPTINLILHVDDGEDTREKFLTTSTFEV